MQFVPISRNAESSARKPFCSDFSLLFAIETYIEALDPDAVPIHLVRADPSSVTLATSSSRTPIPSLLPTTLAIVVAAATFTNQTKGCVGSGHPAP